MPARTTTRTKLLDAGQGLMLERGFSATSVDDVCAEAGVTKGGFFHHFGSKEEFAVALLDHYWTGTQEQLREGQAGAPSDPLGRLHAYLDLFGALARDPAVPKSCLFGNLSQEVAPTGGAVRTACARGFSDWARQIADDVEAAAGSLPSPPAVDALGLAELFIAVYEGSLVLAKASGDAAVLEANVGHFRRYVELLLEGGTRDA